MTGVSAMMCASPPKSVAIPPGSRLAARKVILNDLSPAACHIAYNYCYSGLLDLEALIEEREILSRKFKKNSIGCIEQNMMTDLLYLFITLFGQIFSNV